MKLTIDKNECGECIGKKKKKKKFTGLIIPSFIRFLLKQYR